MYLIWICTIALIIIEIKVDNFVLTLKKFEPLSNLANEQFIKIIVPSNLKNIATISPKINK